MNSRTSDRTFAAAIIAITCLWPATHHALAADPPPPFADNAAHHERFGEQAGDREAARDTVTIRTTVQRTDGAPVEGAVVVTSAGGQGVTNAQGVAVIEVAVPTDADELHITAAATNAHTGENLVGSARLRDLRERSDRDHDAGAIILHANGECLPQWLPTFGAHVGVNGGVDDFAVHDDGSGPALFVVGSLAYAGGILVNGIARWDGNAWSAVGDGFSHPISPTVWVKALAVWDDGSGSGPALYAGGTFLTSGEVEVNRIAKWDGSNWSPLGSGVNQSVHSLAVFDDGNGTALYVGGEFTDAGGVSVKSIAKWDGSAWSSVGPGFSGGQYTRVFAMHVHDDGSGPALYAGGSFTHAGGVFVNHVARWDGVTWSPLNTGVSSNVRALTVFDDGSGPALYAGGAFTHAGSVLVNRVAKWDGTVWSPLKTSTHTGFTYGTVYVLSVFDDGTGETLVVGGNFSVPFKNLVRWTGTSWLGMGSINGAVLALATFDDGSGGGDRLLVGGGFEKAGSHTVNSIARWPGETIAFEPLGNGLNGRVQSLTLFDDGEEEALYAGGEMSLAGGQTASKVIKWNDAEMAWSSLGDIAGATGAAAFLAFDDELGDGETLYAGLHNSANDVVKWNPVAEEWTPLGNGFAAPDPYTFTRVHALAAFEENPGEGPKLFAAGFFATTEGKELNFMARWDGNKWSDVGGGMSHGPTEAGETAQVWALAVYDDGTGPALYAGGAFTYAGDVPVSRVARWDGSKWSDLAGGVDCTSSTCTIYALEVFDDGSGPVLVAAGSFVAIGGVEAKGIAMWDGKSWSSLGTGMNQLVFALAAVEDEDGRSVLYAGGRFTTAGGVAANRVAMWHGESWSPLAEGVDDDVWALKARFGSSERETMLYVGGRFLVSPAGDSYIATWRHCPPPEPVLGDLNGDGNVGVADLLILLSMWGPCDECPVPAGSCPADLNDDCGVGLDDLLILLANWG